MMKRSVQVSVPKPCGEQWSTFTPTKHGGFCGNCQKEVIDFTSWSDDRIKTYFKTKPLNSCGRFHTSQLKVYTFSNTQTSAPTWISLILAFLVAVFNSRQAVGQVKSPAPTEQYQQEHNSTSSRVKSPDTIIQVNGTILLADDGSTLPGVNVLRKGTKEGTSTDADGKFSFTIHNADSIEILEFSFVGLKNVEYTLNSKKSTYDLSIQMEMDLSAISGQVIVGGIVSVRWYNPKRWWWGIKGWFRR